MTTEINKKTWTSDKSENQEYKQIIKLTPETIYNIIDVKLLLQKVIAAEDYSQDDYVTGDNYSIKENEETTFVDIEI